MRSADNILVWLHEYAQQRNLDLGPDVNAPQGDGTNPDYDLAGSWLYAR